MIISKNNEIVPNSEWELDVQLLLTEEDKRVADTTADVDVVVSTADADEPNECSTAFRHSHPRPRNSQGKGLSNKTQE